MNQRAALQRLGVTFQRVREDQRVSVAELAARTGIAHERISELEAGRLDPTYDELLALADGLGVPSAALVPGD